MAELIDRIFNKENMLPSELIIWRSFVTDYFEKDGDDRAAAQVLVDWYQRDRTAIVERMRVIAKLTFPDDETKNWQFPIANFVPRVIKRVSLSYKSPPIRTYVIGDKDINDDVQAKIDNMYRNIDINRKYKDADRWMSLLNTVHVEVVPRKGAIDWDFLLRPAVSIIPDPDDYLDFARLIYRWNIMHPDTLKSESGYVIWDSEKHVFITAGGREIGLSNEEATNPYGGKIPIVTMRKVETDDYWGRFGADLVDGAEQTNLQFANMWENAFLQTHGQPFGKNLGLKPGERVKTGPRHFINVEGVTKDMVEPSLTYPKPENDLTTVRDLIERFMSIVTTDYGMPANAWTMDDSPESGFAKFMDNLELIEDREDMIGQCVANEIKMFDASRMVFNLYAKASEKIPDNVELRVEFPPVEFPESPAEKHTRYTMMFNNGTSDPVDYFMREEGLTEDDAIAKAKRIAERMRDIRSSGSAAFDLPPAIGSKKTDDDEGEGEPEPGDDE